MTKTFITALLLFTSITAFSQTNLDHLLGKWKYQDIYKNELADSTSIQILESFFGDLMLQFNTDESYQAVILGRPDQGLWTLKNDKTILLRSNEGNIVSIEIISLTDTEFICKLERGEFVMKKSAVAEPVVPAKKLPFNTVSANANEITHEWNLSRKDYNKELSGNTEEVAKNIQKSITIVFKKNGRYESQLLGLNEKGSWKFSPGNKSIIITIDGQQRVWNIISVSETELVLIQGNKPEKWYFEVAD